jgi:hypothetical protein
VCKNAFSYVTGDGTYAYHWALNGLLKVYLWPCLSYVSSNISVFYMCLVILVYSMCLVILVYSICV